MTTATPFLSHIYNSIHKRNKNFIGVCVGRTGSGKSWSMLSLCETLDPTFTIDRCVFDFFQLRDLVASKKLECGSFILWDEAQVGVSSRESQSELNKETNKIASTFRNRNYGLIFTCPGLGMIDKWLRELTHYIFEPLDIDYKTNRSLISLDKMDYNAKLDKIYKYPPTITVDDEQIKITSLWVPIPSLKLRTAYENHKNKFQDNLYVETEDKISDEILANPAEYLKHYDSSKKKKLDRYKLETTFKFKNQKQLWRIKNKVEAALNARH